MRKKIYLTSAFFAVFLVFASFINNGFSWLDHGDIERGRAVLTLSNLPRAFISRFGQTGFFRPLVTVANSIDFALYGLWAPGFHLTNILLHLSASFAGALFISRLFSLNFREKLLILLIAGLHPLAFLPVGAISYRQELLLALFTYLTLYFHLRKKLIPAYLCFLAAVSRLLFQLLLPLKPALSDATRVVSMTDFKIIPAAILFVFPVIFFRRLKPDFKKAFILLAVIVLPALNIIPVPRFSSPHYGYVVLPALAAFALLFRKWCLKRYKSETIGNVLVVIWLVI